MFDATTFLASSALYIYMHNSFVLLYLGGTFSIALWYMNMVRFLNKPSHYAGHLNALTSVDSKCLIIQHRNIYPAILC